MSKEPEPRVWLVEKPELTARGVYATREAAEQAVAADPENLSGATVRPWYVHPADSTREN
jgi:hypothetical protein